MSAYFETVAKRKDELVVLFYIVTENATLRKSYSIYTNYHRDHGMGSSMYNHLYTSKKKAFNKVLPEGQKAKKADCKKLPEDIVKSLFKDADNSRIISEPKLITKMHPENNQIIQHQWIRITVSKPGCKEMIYDFPIIRYNKQVNTAENVDGVWYFAKPKAF